MDLGIKGRKAIVCASSRGLGKGCAMALAEAPGNAVKASAPTRRAPLLHFRTGRGYFVLAGHSTWLPKR